MSNTYGEIGNKVAGWYARRLLEHALPVIVLEKFAKIKPLPRNNTKVVKFPRSVAFADATTPLQEGVTPDGSQFSYEDVSVEMRQYGDWSQITDIIDDFSKDDVLGDIAEMQGEQIASTRESLTWDIVRSGTMKRYANGVSGRTAIVQTSLYNAAEARRAVVHLQKQKARKITRILGGGSDTKRTQPRRPISPSAIPIWGRTFAILRPRYPAPPRTITWYRWRTTGPAAPSARMNSGDSRTFATSPVRTSASSKGLVGPVVPRSTARTTKSMCIRRLSSDSTALDVSCCEVREPSRRL